MNAKDVIRVTLDQSENIMNGYVGDLEDSQLMLRPVAGMNHIAWQLGHLIAAERHMIEGIKPGASPALPAGFEENHSKDTASSNDPKKFLSKSEYLRLAKLQREATKAALETISESDLDKPGPEAMRQYAPTVGSVLNLTGTHVLMHVGQFVAVRRALGKPALF